MGALKLTYYEKYNPLKVAYRATEAEQKVVQRFLRIDPYATMYASSTTYNYALNNPVMINDPSGGQTMQNNYGVSEMGVHRYNMTMNRNDPNLMQGYYDSFFAWADDQYAESQGGGGGTHYSDYASIFSMITQWKNEDAVFFQFDRHGKVDNVQYIDLEWEYVGQDMYASLDGMGIDPGETWYYGFQDDHGVAYVPSLNTVYEINHPTKMINGKEKVVDGKLSWVLGGPKSQVYAWRMGNEGVAEKFWAFKNGRPEIMLAAVYVPNPGNAVAFFEANIGGEYPYHVLDNNCQNYVYNGFMAGGATIPIPLLFLGRWSSGQYPSLSMSKP